MIANRSKRCSARLAETAVSQLKALPYAAPAHAGIGGVIKAAPEHFVVEEMLPYEACGEGEHVYVTFRRMGWNTTDVAQAIRERLKLKPADVGWGGRKDKRAVAIQTFSLHCGVKQPLAEVEKAFSDLPFEILAIDRHRNKIKTGHVAANRFRILVSQTDTEALPEALAIKARLQQTGVPNFFGPQRFGHGMKNIQRGFSLFTSPNKGRKQAFMVSVVQSALFNIWLKQRMERGAFEQLLPGDVAQKTDTGGIFTVGQPAIENKRFEAGEIVYTGPIFGFKMKPATAVAGNHEADLLGRFGFTLEDFRRFRAPGSRRAAIVRLSDLHVVETAMGLQFTFTLPAGAYATIVLREFTRQ